MDNPFEDIEEKIDAVSKQQYKEPFCLLSPEDIESIEENAVVSREKLLVLYRGLNYSIKEIAELFEVTPHTINKLLSEYMIFKSTKQYLLYAPPNKSITELFCECKCEKSEVIENLENI
ncbi:hypothetical protein [Methanohalobium sp.]|uniref:hypothetical protein n=1 Tax=Methanohalobium sp. TaxID=2837493 RepID=UPI0025FEE6A8|nr:hypothetical protein [Methanohalobium sp.]